MGTISFDAKFGKMHKEEDFIVYPINSQTANIIIQSDRRFAVLSLNGELTMSSGKKDANHFHLRMDIQAGKAEKIVIPMDEMEILLNAIRATSSRMAGTNGIMYTNNEGAIKL